MVRYLYAPGELEGGEWRRATVPLWSLTSHQVERAVFEGGKPVLFYLSDGPKRTNDFTRGAPSGALWDQNTAGLVDGVFSPFL